MQGIFGQMARHNSTISFARSTFIPSIRMPLTRTNWSFGLKLGRPQRGFFKDLTLTGFVQEAKIAKYDTMQRKPAYGYMYYEEAQGNKNALMDFNRINDGVYTFKTPVISIPVYTYDVFSINGEGTGGTFRGYRGNMGYVRDNYTASRTGGGNLFLDIGTVPPDKIHIGGTIGGTYTPSYVEEWQSLNRLRQAAAFNKSDGIYQGFYFKNPGEKAIIDEDYYHQIGEDRLMRPYLVDNFTASPSLAGGFQVFDKNRNIESTIRVDPESYRHARDKRAQVITYFTAKEAADIALNKKITSYTENVFKPGNCTENDAYRFSYDRYLDWKPGYYRKAHHISAINVLEPGGQTYVYDLPVYQVKQKEVVFSTMATPVNNMVAYTPGYHNTTNNSEGREGYYSSETMDGYAHSYLLTGILSPDYVDVTGNGISDDDLGVAIKFNYSRINRQNIGGTNDAGWPLYKWRMPADSANYNEGLKSDDRDDKGLYTYGEKELWYLHSVESKNIVATFRISDREDGKSVRNEHGGPYNSTQKLKKLDRIDFYTKADFLKYGSNARPISTVHLRYSYKMCQGFPLNSRTISENTGKLTLDSLWFTYNGNERQRKNKYVFKYSSVNPNYNSSENDRWGSYKDHEENPSGMLNRDYPFSLQGNPNSNAFASAWCLKEILLPSGGIIQVDYEADDYAYVQDKRASQMTAIAGFGLSATDEPTNKLYSRVDVLSYQDHRFVFFDVDDPIADKAELSARYMQDFRQLLLKLWVLLPAGSVNMKAEYEPITIYSTIKDYGLVPTGPTAYDHNRFYIELEPTKKGGSPIMQTVLQFMKDYLPHRAYPGREVNDGGGVAQVINTVWGLVNAFMETLKGFEGKIKSENKCRNVELNYSYARLNNPQLKKAGGGHRVKRIVIGDNWKKMSGRRITESGMHDSWYGQEYSYTTTEELKNGEEVEISSGVASYEPGIGNEENPFREVLKYQEKQFLGPTDYNNIELPVTETFFPAAGVGYSKVVVRSIHRNTDTSKLRSAIGLQQTEFFTTKDFPVITDFTSFDHHSRHHHKPSFLNKVFKFNRQDYLTLTQGFRIVLNDMNGKIKSQTSFPENDLKHAINYTSYHYRTIQYGDNKYRLDNVVPVISGPNGKVTNKLIGRDVEIMNDFRQHFSTTYAADIPLNADIFSIGILPIILPSVFRMAFRDESMYRSATTMKIVNEFGILDSVTNIDKGSMVSTHNLVYDAESGDVLVSRTNNEFDKPVYQFNYPAWWVHAGMEPAYRNIDLTYKNVLFRNGRIEESPHVNMDYFESGDEIYVDDMANKGPRESIPCIIGGLPDYLPMSGEKRIWALDIRKDTRYESQKKEFIFIDRYGTPYNAANATIRIIRSGKRNMSGTSVGSVVSMASPIRQRTTGQWIIIDDTTNVINSGAVEFRDKWRATDQFYQRDTTIVTVRRTPIRFAGLRPAEVYSAQWRREYGKNGNWRFLDYKSMYNRSFEIMKKRITERLNLNCPYFFCDVDKVTYDQNSWMRFDLTNYPTLEGSTVLNATLHLRSHNYAHNFPKYPIGPHAANQAHIAKGPYHEHANMMKFTLMRTPWYTSSDDANWKSIFFDNTTTDWNLQNFVLYNPNPSYAMSPATADYDVSVKYLAQGMVNNYGSSVATGLKFSYYTESRTMDYNHGNETIWRNCFAAFDTIPGSEVMPRQVTLDVNYYKCSETDTLIYQGVAVNDTIAAPPGYIHCKTSVVGRYCFSVFTRKMANPYVSGALTNFRPFRSYVFYGERRENDFAGETDIRKDGVIKDFVPYWIFGQTMLTKTNEPRWVWNSEITQVNRKGAELENHDPLDRYNAGIYGYQESLPVAVVNNSRLRLSAFDGFEDYLYQDDPCEPFCKPSKRHFETRIPTGNLDTTEAHTGKYSLKINTDTERIFNIPVSGEDTVYVPDIRVSFDSTLVDSIYEVNPNGNGRLRGYYYNNTTFSGSPAAIVDEDEVKLVMNPIICNPSNPFNPPSGVGCSNTSVVWKGYVQVATTGNYEFNVSEVNDWAEIYIDGNLALHNDLNLQQYYIRNPVPLIAGELHEIEVKYVQNTGIGQVYMTWKVPGSNSFTLIPTVNLYSEGQEDRADGTTKSDTAYCIKPDTINAINHHLIDSLNFLEGRKMVASVWLKVGGEDCHCTGYTGNFSVRNASAGIIAEFKPRERIIEGWQQFEAVFTVPAGNKVELYFRAPKDAPVYIDDLRLHPFNANMKSFVYNSFNLRLAAELDENNFASFYEYDDEGTLVRIKKETRLGIKTIKETRSALQKEINKID